MTTTSVTSGTTSGNVTVTSGNTLVVDFGGVVSGLTVDSGGTVLGSGGAIFASGGNSIVNGGLIETMSGFDPYLAIVGNVSNTSTIEASAGADQFAELLMTSGTVVNGSGGVIEAVATASFAGAFVELSDVVSGGKIVANGTDAHVALDGATVSGAGLQTLNGGHIGIFGSGAATVTSATVSAGAFVFDDGTLTFNGGAVQTGATFESKDGVLTLSGMSFGAGDILSATELGSLTVDAGSGGTNTFRTSSLLEVTDLGSAGLSGGLSNSGAIIADVVGGVANTGFVTINAGGSGVSNAKGALIEALTTSGYSGDSLVQILGSGSATNSGTIEALASSSVRGFAEVALEAGFVTNATTIEATATSNTTTLEVISAIGGVTNSGAMLASASDDSTTNLTIHVSGGTITNTKTIESLATANATDALSILDDSHSASLFNAKGAVIEASATGFSDVQSMDIFLGSGITNSGTIALLASGDSEANGLISGGSLLNAGTISAMATSSSTIGFFVIDVTSGGTTGLVSNTGSITIAAAGDSTVFGTLSGGSLVNSGSITESSTTGGTAKLTVDILTTSLTGLFTNAKGAVISAFAYDIVESGGAITNSGAIALSVTSGEDDGTNTISGGSLTNGGAITASATGGIIGALDMIFSAFGSGAIINSGSIALAASDGGSVTGALEGVSLLNTGSITQSAAAGSTAALTVQVVGSGGFVTNNKGATIEAHHYDVAVGTGTITNSGTMALSVSAGITNNNLISGGSVINAGSLTATAADGRTIGGFAIAGSGGVSNTGIISFTANSATITSAGISGGTLVNAGGASIALTAIAGGMLDTTAIDVAGAITNSGTIAISDSGDSTISNTEITAGSLTNASTGKIAYTASGAFSNIQSAAIDVGGAFTNSGSIAYAATSTSEIFEPIISAATFVNASGGKISYAATGAAAGVAYVEDAAIEANSLTNSGSLTGVAAMSGYVQIFVATDGADSSLINGGTVEASATGAGGQAYMYLVASSGGAITNSKLIEASGTGGGSAFIYLGGDPSIAGMNNSSGTLLASGSAFIDLGYDFGVALSGGTLETVGPDAFIGVDEGGDASASDVTIVKDSNIVGFAGALTLSGIVGSISGGTLVEAADNGTVLLSGNLNNSGTMEALGSGGKAGEVVISAGAAGTAANSGTMEAVLTSTGDGASLYASGGTVSNTKTIEAVTSDSVEFGATVTISGGTVTNAATGTIEVLATSADNGFDSAVGSVTGTMVVNDGAMLVAATDESGDSHAISLSVDGISGVVNSGSLSAVASEFSSATLSVSGGIVTNDKTIGATATLDSFVGVDILGSGAGSVVSNSGSIVVSATESSDAGLDLANSGGTIVNTKTITVVATDQSTASAVISATSIVNSSGAIVASGGADSTADVYFGGTVSNTSGTISATGNGAIWLDNATISGGTLRTTGVLAAIIVSSGGVSGIIEDATISGQAFPQFGGHLILGNAAVIASGALVEAIEGGTVVVGSGAVITNSGTLLAGDLGPGTVVVSGTVSGNAVTVGGDGLVNVASGGFANVAFGVNDNGTLELADISGGTGVFSGTVTGFGGFGGEYPDQLIELGGVAYDSGASATFTPTGFDSGTLTVSSGATIYAAVKLVGDYINATFTIVDDGGKLAVSDPLSVLGGTPTTLASTADKGGDDHKHHHKDGASNVALLGSYMASVFGSPGIGQVATQTLDTAQPDTVLTHPHTG